MRAALGAREIGVNLSRSAPQRVKSVPPLVFERIVASRSSRKCLGRALRAGAVDARRPCDGGVPNAAAALGCQRTVEAKRRASTAPSTARY